jgi:GrpB-like predicted nucleotidyltransferase (UPF0157 family)
LSASFQATWPDEFQALGTVLRQGLGSLALRIDHIGSTSVPGLARRHSDDAKAYYDLKDPVCDIIMGGAEAWAAATDWQPGPSDC